MNIWYVVLAGAVTILGLFPLRQMYRWERAPLQFCLAYFTLQHFVYGFGGVLLALADRGYLYQNFHGTFAWIDGLPRLQVLHLASLCAGLAGVRIGVFIFRGSVLRPSADVGKAIQYIVWSTGPLLRRLCYVSLFAHAVLILLQWYSNYAGLQGLPVYVVATLSPVASVSFFFWGLWWRDAEQERVVFLVWMVLFGLIQMASGGRAPALLSMLLFAYGVFLVSTQGSWMPRPRHVVMGMVGVILVGWLMVVSDDLRGTYGSRRPQNVQEWVERIKNLFSFKPGIGIASGGHVFGYETSPFERVTFHFASRIVDLSSLDVIARTPEQIPYAGWQAELWPVLATNWLPGFFFPHVTMSEEWGPTVLRRHGWYIQIEGERTHSMPITMLADSWRRFGWIGVIGFNFSLALLWTSLSLWSAARLAGRRFHIRWFVINSSLLTAFATMYFFDPVSLFVNLPRRFILVSGYAVALSAICQWMSKQRVVRVISPYGIRYRSVPN